jgi:superfamily II DNA or RNA helicase
MLDELDLVEVYDSAEHDIVADLQIPLLSSSVSYLRGVGYFSSGWMRLASHGLQSLVENGGRARIIVSPILDASDWEAIQTGNNAIAADALRRSLEINVNELADHLEHDTRNSLAWMVADGLVEFRFAVERNRQIGDYHDKVAIFEDLKGNTVALHGSFNDSVKATYNGEAFSVFRSWTSGHEVFVQKHKSRLVELWSGGNAQFATFTIPDAVRESIVRLRSTPLAPYGVRDRSLATEASPRDAARSHVRLRDYQLSAIENWRRAGYRGILEMATGTGKTITALSAAVASIAERGTRVVLVLVPYLHLMEQWGRDASTFGLKPLYCSSAHSDWARQLRSLAIDAALPGSSTSCVIAVHHTAATERFANSICRLDGRRVLLVADEVHCLGARHLRKALTGGADLRLGLSATPHRWFDEEGTGVLNDYFGGTCFDLPLESVIGTILTPYRYLPQPINLEADELVAYLQLSKQIAAMLSSGGGTDDDRLKSLLLRRTRVIAGARRKLPALINVVRNELEAARCEGTELRDTLVYAPPGHHSEYLLALSRLGLRCHEFVHHVPLAKRDSLLRQFASGDIQVLVAVKCLDEGVDVPSTRTAFILASSTNPREFVQRRGRILRRAEGKERADVYDFLVLPDAEAGTGCDDGGRSLLRREMPRFAEFASSAMNEFEARAVIRPLLDECQMLPLLDRRPWDVYKESKQPEWELEHE